MRPHHLLLLLTACGEDTASPVGTRPVPFDGTFCTLPGAVVHDGGDRYLVAGGPAAPALDWLHVPSGFCAHYFANVPAARQIKVAPGGELFAASPSRSTAGGAPVGVGSIIALADDDRDGQAEVSSTFLGGLEAVQGLLFTGGSLYYQDDRKIERIAYAPGQRSAPAKGDAVVDIEMYSSGLHWPKVLDVADDGAIYVTNGGDQGEACDMTRPFHGGIVRIDGSPGGAQVEKGFRNPIALRCLPGHNSCWIAELSLDASGNEGGREKIVPVHQGDDLGYPCCATQGVPFPNVTPVPDCSAMTPEDNAFLIGETPFGLEFEVPHLWPAPFTGALFVALHGEFGTWQGARLVAIATDPTTGAPLPSTDTSGHPTDSLVDFATGWDTGHQDHGRPAALAGAPDGRLYLANDATGDILWFAPIGLRDPTPP